MNPDPAFFLNPDPVWIRFGSGLDPVLDSDPDSVWIRIRIDKKGWIPI
jgi:hypothetical protein